MEWVRRVGHTSSVSACVYQWCILSLQHGFEIFSENGVIKAWKKDSENKVVKGMDNSMYDQYFHMLVDTPGPQVMGWYINVCLEH